MYGREDGWTLQLPAAGRPPSLQHENVVRLIITAGVIGYCLDSIYVPDALFGKDLRGWHVFVIGTSLAIAMLKRYRVPRLLFAFATFIALHCSLGFFVNGSALLAPIVQTVGVCVVIGLCWGAARIITLNGVKQLVMVSATIIALTVLIEHGLYLALGMKLYTLPLFDYSGTAGPLIRAAGIMGEPSQGAILIVPAFLWSLFGGARVQALLFAAASVLTLSLLTLFALMLAGLLYILVVGGYRRTLIALAFTGVATGCMLMIGPIRTRIRDGAAAAVMLQSGSLSGASLRNLDASWATLTLNSAIAVESLRQTHLVGVGFGNFQNAFTRHAERIGQVSEAKGSLFYNRAGAGSLFIRIVAELGIAGVIIGIMFALIYVRSIWHLRIYRKAGGRRDLIAAAAVGMLIVLAYASRKDAYANAYFGMGIVTWLQTFGSIKVHRRKESLSVRQ